MKKWLMGLTAALCLMVCLAVKADAAEIVDSGYCGGEGDGTNLIWTLDNEGTLVISGYGAMESYIMPPLPWIKSGYPITSVVFNEGVTSIAGGFSDKLESIASVSLPSSLINIGNGAFYCCSLTDVTIPDSVTTIGQTAFSFCEMESIRIPAQVSHIGVGAFGDCYNLTNITVDGKNSVYRDIDGVLFSADGTELHSYPIGRTASSFQIPPCVKKIKSRAFSGCYNLTNMVIPANVTSIDSSAFSWCNNLAEITILSNTIRIDIWAFEGSSLTDVYFCGTEAQWLSAVGKKDIGLRNDVTIHYNWTEDIELDELEQLLSTDPTIYNNNLALIAAKLSEKTYNDGGGDPTSVENYLQYDLGFEKENIHSKNYGKPLAFTIATKEYPGDEYDEIVVVVAQGTTLQLDEIVYDAFGEADARNKQFFGGYSAYKAAEFFYSEIVQYDYKDPTYLAHFVKHDKRYKFLLTGHSLGGAAVNLIAANLTAKRHIGYGIGDSDVFCYTFGAIDSIKTDYPIEDGYRNIHNVYNEADTLSPQNFGWVLFSGAGSRNGKFGVLELFDADYRTDEEKSKSAIEQATAAVNHGMSNYLEAVESGKVENSILRPNSDAYMEWAVDYLVHQLPYYSLAGCPVDIEVYREGELVGRVVNNVVDESLTGVKIMVDGDTKFILYPDRQQYDLKITAYDEGTMTFYTQDLSGTGQVKMMPNVALTAGKTMTSMVSGDIATIETQLFVVDEDDNILFKVEADGTERAVDTETLTFSHTEAIDTGEAVRIDAVMENFTDSVETVCVCAALYADGRMVGTQLYSDVAIPVKREVRKTFELAYSEEQLSDDLSVKLFFLDAEKLTPISGGMEVVLPVFHGEET